MKNRKGDWIQTYTGKQFWPIDPKPDEICIEDIAHALSLQCRFAGHCIQFYSVAEHSILLSRHVSQNNKLWALLHDASEAYLVDIPRPVKPFLTNYKELENKLMNSICIKFGLELEMPEEVSNVDRGILQDEASQNMVLPPKPWQTDKGKLGIDLLYLSPYEAENLFLTEFRKLK